MIVQNKVQSKKIRILYMGTPEISAVTLKMLIEAGYNIVGLIAQVDKEVGRKHILEKVPTKVVAEEFNIPVYQVENIKNNYEFVKEINPDLILTLAYGQIIPQGLIDIPKYGCLNLHGSILPKYRGAAPIQRAILNGDTETGISLMEMVDKMDAGKVYAVEKVKIEDNDNYTSLQAKLSLAAFNVTDHYLELYLNGLLPGVKQDESLVTIAKKIKPEDELLTKELSVKEFVNKVRALAMVPGAYILVNDKKIKVFDAEKVDDIPNEIVGELIFKKGVYLTLKDGLVHLKLLQLEGKKILDDKSFANGGRIFEHAIIN